MTEPRIVFSGDASRLGDLVYRARKSRHITQASLASLSKTSTATARAIEYGYGTVKLETLAEVLKNVGMELRIQPSPARGGGIHVNLKMRYHECAKCGFEFIATQADWCPRCGYEGAVTPGLFDEWVVVRL